MNQKGFIGLFLDFFGPYLLFAVIIGGILTIVGGFLLISFINADCGALRDHFGKTSEVGQESYYLQCASPGTDTDAGDNMTDLEALAAALGEPAPTTDTVIEAECVGMYGLFGLFLGYENWGKPYVSFKQFCNEGETCVITDADQYTGYLDDGMERGKNFECKPALVIEYCGNGKIDKGGEECEWDEEGNPILGDATCKSQGLKPGDGLGCYPPDSAKKCKFDTRNCGGKINDCGNGIIEPDEECDVKEDMSKVRETCIAEVEGCTEENVDLMIGTAGKTCDEIFERTGMIGGPPTCIMTGANACTFDRTDNRGTTEGECTSCGNEICENGTEDTPDLGENPDTCPEDCPSGL